MFVLALIAMVHVIILLMWRQVESQQLSYTARFVLSITLSRDSWYYRCEYRLQRKEVQRSLPEVISLYDLNSVLRHFSRIKELMVEWMMDIQVVRYWFMCDIPHDVWLIRAYWMSSKRRREVDYNFLDERRSDIWR